MVRLIRERRAVELPLVVRAWGAHRDAGEGDGFAEVSRLALGLEREGGQGSVGETFAGSVAREFRNLGGDERAVVEAHFVDGPGERAVGIVLRHLPDGRAAGVVGDSRGVGAPGEAAIEVEESSRAIIDQRNVVPVVQDEGIGADEALGAVVVHPGFQLARAVVHAQRDNAVALRVDRRVERVGEAGGLDPGFDSPAGQTAQVGVGGFKDADSLRRAIEMKRRADQARCVTRAVVQQGESAADHVVGVTIAGPPGGEAGGWDGAIGLGLSSTRQPETERGDDGSDKS